MLVVVRGVDSLALPQSVASYPLENVSLTRVTVSKVVVGEQQSCARFLLIRFFTEAQL